MARKPSFADTSSGGDNSRLAQKMRQYRERANLTQTDVERLSGVRRDYLSSIELGRISVVYPETLNRLRRVYGFPGWEMLDAMGYQTDAGGEAVEPALLAIIRALTPEQQRMLADMAKATLRFQSTAPNKSMPVSTGG